MAEFCQKCWNELNDTDYPESKYILSKTLELCEGCGEFTNVIIAERKVPYLKSLKFITVLVKPFSTFFESGTKKKRTGK